MRQILREKGSKITNPIIMEESDVGNFWEEELMMSASGEQPKDITEKLWEEDSMMSGKENRKGKQKKALSNSKGKRLKQQQKKGIERLENYNPLSEEDLTRLFPAYPSSNEPCHCEKAKNEGKCECNYLLSFDVEDHEQIKHYLDVYGVCIVRLLDEETCQKTVDSFFEEANQKAKYQPIDINNPESWESTNWPGRGKFLFDTPAFTQQAYDNRTNEKFYKLSAYLFNEPKLYCSIDNWGLFRPTRNISFSKEHFTKWQNGRVAKGNLFEEKSYDFDKNEKLPPPENFIENYHAVEHATHVVMDRPDWRRNLRPHWDVNPWIFHKETLRKETQLLQSLVALVDCTDNGSFACVPCSHRYIPSKFCLWRIVID